MKLVDAIRDEMIVLDADYKSREELFKDFSERFYKSGVVENAEAFVDALLERESVCSTFCSMNIAIPHGISETVKTPSIGFCRLKNPIDWDGDNETPVKFIFMIAMPKREYTGEENEHIKLLSKIAILSLEDNVQENWNSFKTIKEFKDYLNDSDK